MGDAGLVEGVSHPARGGSGEAVETERFFRNEKPGHQNWIEPVIVSWILVAVACLIMFWRCRFLLSPTAIFFAYFALVFPLSYLVSYALDLPFPIFLAPRAIPHDKVAFAFAQVLLALACFCIGRFLLPGFQMRWRNAQIRSGRFLPLVITATLMALAGGAFVVWKIGGLAALIEDSGGLRSGELRGLGAGTFAVTALLPTVAQFGLMYALKVKSKWKWALLILCALSCTLGGASDFAGSSLFS